MGIKWEDVKVAVAALSNEIYIGKVKDRMFIDKSGTKTEDCVKAVMEHMRGREDNTPDKEYVAYTIPNIGELRWYDFRKNR